MQSDVGLVQNTEVFSNQSQIHNLPTSQTITDGEMTCDRKTALCTKVHRAVTKQIHININTKPYYESMNKLSDL